jgi:hypothetical protein
MSSAMNTSLGIEPRRLITTAEYNLRNAYLEAVTAAPSSAPIYLAEAILDAHGQHAIEVIDAMPAAVRKAEKARAVPIHYDRPPVAADLAAKMTRLDAGPWADTAPKSAWEIASDVGPWRIAAACALGALFASVLVWGA